MFYHLLSPDQQSTAALNKAESFTATHGSGSALVQRVIGDALLDYFLPAPPGQQTEPPASAMTAFTTKFPRTNRMKRTPRLRLAPTPSEWEILPSGRAAAVRLKGVSPADLFSRPVVHLAAK